MLLTGTSALVKWNENWVTFLDTIAQTFIYQQDSRNPTLLTSIEKLVINVKKHYEILSTLNEDKGEEKTYFKNSYINSNPF